MKNMDLVYVECEKEKNIKYNDNVNISDFIKDIFSDKKIDSVSIDVLNDIYINYLNKNKIKDTAENRTKFIQSHPDYDFDNAFNNSSAKDLFDVAVIPVAIFNRTLKRGEHVFKMTDTAISKIKKLVSEKAAKDVDIIISDIVYSAPDCLEDIIDELLAVMLDEEERLECIDEISKIKFADFQPRIFGFIPVILKIKFPRVVTREYFNSLENGLYALSLMDVSPEEISDIITENFDEQIVSLANFVTPEEYEDFLDEWEEMYQEHAKQKIETLKKIENIKALHSKKKK